ncbi:hypothetical protein N879_04215 [Alcaligenes sp. EGD-AK7]|uniref:hypothetical protein n=1 Tax=Alcaligenes sp. EGD-AK7 TaxID=1386079 RepID=UPI0002AAE23C|nr:MULTISPECIES: hypothetical protein [unclassified Alcaligenes]EKU29884.1 hypothetical protein C660_11842 [Alcaligenes sp. HPC1271]ERI34748.1 hypothetical protein N879_04215 [Alcaligenes sp. EGD-AK7]
MNITLVLTPQVPIGDVAPLTVVRQGEKITINGEVLDLSFMEQGDSLPAGSIEHPLLGGASVIRDETGILIDGLLFHIAASQTDPAACFPEPVIISHDGVVALPAQAPAPPSPVPEPEPEQIEIPTMEPEDEHQD